MLGRNALPQLASLYGIYLLWAALLASASSYLAAAVGLAKLTRILATAILVGSLLGALLSLLQPWLLIGFPASYGGPLGQANHFTSYIWLGLASVLYLRMTGSLSLRMFWAIVALLTFTAVLIGQRSSFLYALILIGIVFWQTRRAGSAFRPDVRRLALGIALLFVVLQPVTIFLPAFGIGETKPPPVLRATQQFSGPSIRLQLWRVGWEGIAVAPLMGQGIGTYPTLALAHADTIPAADNPGSAESAHNLFIDLAVDLGLPAALFVLLASIVWLWRVLKITMAAEGIWALSVFSILGLHALIEYPLAYSYFLALLAVVAGAFGGARQVGQRLAPIALSLGLMVWGSLALADLRRDYQLLEMSLELGKQPATLRQARKALLSISSNTLLSPWVNTTACVSLDPLTVSVRDGLTVCGITMKFVPVAGIINQVVLQWRAGDIEGARTLLRKLKQITQHNPREVETELEKFITRDSRIRELLDSPPKP